MVYNNYTYTGIDYANGSATSAGIVTQNGGAIYNQYSGNLAISDSIFDTTPLQSSAERYIML